MIDSLSFYEDTLAVVCYHVGHTYQTAEALDRQVFYDTNLVIPYTIFDGTDVVWEMSPSNYVSVFQTHIEVARSTTPHFNLYINSASASPTTGTIDLRIVAADTIPDDVIVAFVSILEDSLLGIDLPGAIYYHVCRSLYQFPLDLAYPDSLDTTITFSHSIPPDKMKTVIFIQDMDTKEVMQTIIRDF